MAGEFDEIRGRLEAISEELADLAIERLRESIDAGGDGLDPLEGVSPRSRTAATASATTTTSAPRTTVARASRRLTTSSDPCARTVPCPTGARE